MGDLPRIEEAFKTRGSNCRSVPLLDKVPPLYSVLRVPLAPGPNKQAPQKQSSCSISPPPIILHFSRTTLHCAPHFAALRSSSSPTSCGLSHLHGNQVAALPRSSFCALSPALLHTLHSLRQLPPQLWVDRQCLRRQSRLRGRLGEARLALPLGGRVRFGRRPRPSSEFAGPLPNRQSLHRRFVLPVQDQREWRSLGTFPLLSLRSSEF